MGLLIKKKGMVDMKIKVILKENIKGVGKKDEIDGSKGWICK